MADRVREIHHIHNTTINEPSEVAFSKLSQVVWFIIGIIEILLVLRFTFKAFGARASDFTLWLYSITEPFVGPFYGIFPSPSAEGIVLDLATLLALLAVVVIGGLIAALINLLRPSSE